MPGDARPGELTTSPQGRAFIQRWELNGKRQPYFDVTPDVLGNPTFGYGHKVLPAEAAGLRKQLQGLDQAGRAALIDNMFSQDLSTAERRVKDRLGPEAMQTLTQPQFDALVADAFNAGSGGALGAGMLQNIWDGDMASAGNQFNAYSGTDAKTGQKVVLTGLVRRGLEQAAMFNRGDYGYVPTQQEIDMDTRAAIAARVRKTSRE